MATLPDPSTSSGNKPTNANALAPNGIPLSGTTTPAGQANAQAGGRVTGREKEVETPGPVEAPRLPEVGREAQLPPEVTSAGVKIQPTTVTIPPKVAQLGVKPVGQPSLPPAASVTLPLTDDQIARGLHQSIANSWRWLAEWCLRRLKQLHLAIKSIHGKVVRVQT